MKKIGNDCLVSMGKTTMFLTSVYDESITNWPESSEYRWRRSSFHNSCCASSKTKINHQTHTHILCMFHFIIRFIIYFQDAVSAIGGVIGAMNIPERWFPGAVDLYLNSHNIMHVLVVSAVYSMHQVTENIKSINILIYINSKMYYCFFFRQLYVT